MNPDSQEDSLAVGNREADAGSEAVHGRLDRLFGRRLSPGARSFIRNLSWIGICFAISKAITMLASIVAARMLGASNLGNLSLVFRIQNLFQIGMLFGMPNALVMFGASKQKPESEIAFSALVVIAATVIIGVPASLGHAQIAQAFKVDPIFVWYGIQLAMVSALYMVFITALQARHEYAKRGIAEILLAALMFPGIALGYFLYGRSPGAMFIAYMLCYSVPAIVMATMLLPNFNPVMLRGAPRRAMLNYGLAACFGNIGSVLTFVLQPFQIEWALGSSTVGHYQVYSTASIANAMYLTSAFSTVFFPKAASTIDKAGLWSVAIRAWKKYWPAMLIVYFAIEVAMVVMAGRKEYPLDWTLVFLFGVAATLITVQASIGQIVIAQGVASVRWGILMSSVGGIINVIATHFLLPRMQLAGAAVALILTYTFFLAGTVVLHHHLVGRQERAIQ